MIASYVYFRFLSYSVFVNRSLRLGQIKFYGFDMDYTLAGELFSSKR